MNNIPRYDTHYSKSMSPKYMSVWGKSAAVELERCMMADAGFRPVLVYRGMSGIAAATAIISNLEAEFCDRVGMIYVRKDHEDSHGRDDIEVGNPDTLQNNPTFVVCDDFIDSGYTILTILKTISGILNKRIAPSKVRYAMTNEPHGVIMTQKKLFYSGASSGAFCGDATAANMNSRYLQWYNRAMS